MVRLAGIDAPETFRPECEAERTAGEVAKEVLESRIDGTVWLTDIEEDKYAGRVVADAHAHGGELRSAGLW
ncbi:MAG: thermonuclease family protein [Planctomycetota bacterium]